MTPLTRTRLETNVDTYQDAAFTASVSGSIMTVSAVHLGKIMVGSMVWDVGGIIPLGTLIQSGPSSGGVGDYVLSNTTPLTVPSGKVAAGNESLMSPTEIDVQLDIHSASLSRAGDMATTVSTLFRDDRATTFFADYPGIAPLFADDPRQVPFINAENQWESRWIVTACLQINSTIVLPQQFADQLQVTLKPVDVIIPVT